MNLRKIVAKLALASVGFAFIQTAGAACLFTQGYWQNRAQNAGDASTLVWASLSGDAFYLSGLTYAQVLQNQPRGNAYWVLAHQDVAAEANALVGGDLSGDGMATALAASEQLLAKYTPAQIGALPKGDPLRSQFIQLAGILDQWNNGLIGTGICLPPNIGNN
jgi:hypothetical protein